MYPDILYAFFFSDYNPTNPSKLKMKLSFRNLGYYVKSPRLCFCPQAVCGQPLNETTHRVLLYVKNTGDALPEKEKKKKKNTGERLCVHV